MAEGLLQLGVRRLSSAKHGCCSASELLSFCQVHIYCKLQIVDSDFAKQFKALVRKKLLAFRREFQRAQKNTSSAFKAGALKIVRQEMAAKNWQDQKWPLSLEA